MYRLKVLSDTDTSSLEFSESAEDLNFICTYLRNFEVPAQSLEAELNNIIRLKNNSSYTITSGKVPITVERKRNFFSKMSNDAILDTLKENASRGIEWHSTIYDDNIWKLDIEYYPYGTIRFWVSREDSYRRYNATQLSIYEYNGKIKHSAEFKIKSTVLNKALSVYKVLKEADLL